MNPDGLITLSSKNGVKETVDRFEAEVKKRGMNVFCAWITRLELPPPALKMGSMELLLFGHARSGTPLMLRAATIGIDLPLKTLAWQDDEGKVWLAYNQPQWVAERHRIGSDAHPILVAMTAALEEIARFATESA